MLLLHKMEQKRIEENEDAEGAGGGVGDVFALHYGVSGDWGAELFFVSGFGFYGRDGWKPTRDGFLRAH